MSLNSSTALSSVTEIPAAKKKNDTRYNDLKKFAKTLGEDEANGKDALPKLARAIVTAADEGILSKTKNIKSRFVGDKGEVEFTDSVGELYEIYMETMGSKAVHERSTKSIGVQISKLRKFYEFGVLEHVDAVVIMDKAQEIYTKVNTPYKDDKSKGCYVYYQDVAKAQCEKDHRNTELTDAEIEGLLWKAEPGEKTLEGELERAMKILDTLIKGDGKAEIKDTHANTAAAYQLLKERVGELAKMARIEELRAEAVALGIIL